MSLPTTPQHHADGAYVGDEPIDRVIFDTLTPRQRARLRGSQIFAALIDSGIGDQLAALKRDREAKRGRNQGQKPERFGAQAIAVLAIFTNVFGELVDDFDGLLVDRGREEIASKITGSWKSTYPLIQQLASVGAVICKGGAGRRDLFWIPQPVPASDKSCVRESDKSVLPSARARQDLSRCTDNVLPSARAGQDKSCLSESGAVQSGVSEAPAERCTDSARTAGYDDDDDELKSNTSSSSCGPEENSEADASQVFAVLVKSGIWPNIARQLSRTTSLLDAVAVSIMRKQRKLKTPQGMATALRNDQIDEAAREEAYRRLYGGRPAKATPNASDATNAPSVAADAKGGSPDDDDYRIG